MISNSISSLPAKSIDLVQEKLQNFLIELFNSDNSDFKKRAIFEEFSDYLAPETLQQLSEKLPFNGIVQKNSIKEITSVKPWSLTSNKVALAFLPYAEADESGAFSISPEAEAAYTDEEEVGAPDLSEEAYSTLGYMEVLAQQSFSLQIRRPFSLQYATEHLVAINAELSIEDTKASLFMHCGHGDLETIRWNTGDSNPYYEPDLSVDNIDEPAGVAFFSQLDKALAPDASVLLDACSTAESAYGLNLATEIAMRLPGRTIYAAADTLFGVKPISGSNPPKFKLVGKYGKDVTVKIKYDAVTQVCTARTSNPSNFI